MAAPLRLGIIGCGRVAEKRHLPAIAKLKGIRVVAAADTDPARLDRVADRWNIKKKYTEHTALIDDKNIDAVAIFTPPSTHYRQALDAIANDRHVFIETPLATSPGECNKLVEAASASSVVVMAGLSLRFHPLVDRARHYVQAGRLGPVRGISSIQTTPSRGLRADRLPQWRLPHTMEGNVFMEGAIHYFDVWNLLTGSEIRQVQASCSTVGGPVALNAWMQDSTVAAAIFSEYGGDNSEIRLTGRDGTVALSLYKFNGFDYCPAMTPQGSISQHLHHSLETVRSLPSGLHRQRLGGNYAFAFIKMWESFINSVRGVEPVYVTLGDASRATRAALAAGRSMVEGIPVAVETM